MTRFAFSCVVDNDPVLVAQAFIWLNCMRSRGGFRDEDIFVHITDLANTEFLNWVRSSKVNVIEIEPFDERSPHSNKIEQLKTFVHSNYDQVVCMDCDTAWIGDRALPVGAPVAASIVHQANPPEQVLSDIFAASTLGPPEWFPVFFADGEGRELSDRNNCNGGLYIIQQDFVSTLEPKWREWARWALDRHDLFASWAFFTDQVSFALAMRDIGANVRHLDLVWNYPTNVATELLPDIPPQLLHYHRELTPHLKLKKVGRRRVDDEIDKFNSAIEQYVSNTLLNSVFWDFRYSAHPEFGSGVGSRGAALSNKTELLEKALGGFLATNVSVVDVGCGDLELTRHLPLADYLGVDVSQASLELASSKRPDWKFELLPLGAGVPEADIVLCIDVLIHQKTEAAFLSLIEQLAGATRRRLVVGGYEAPPRFTSEITAYHLPLTQALKNTGNFIDIQVIGFHRETVIVVADKWKRDDAAANAVKISTYYDGTARIREGAAVGDHRTDIDDVWEEIGQLQFEFLKDNGLQACHCLLDVGCGALRGGVHFIRYLEQGNYVGVDMNQSVLDAGYDVTLRMLNLQSRMPRENLIRIDAFDFTKLDRQFDFAMAQSLFTHLTFNQIRECLTRLTQVVEVGGIFFASFFELPRTMSTARPHLHSPGDVTTYSAADPYHYWLSDMFYAALELPWQVRYIGDWGHPRALRMLSFCRTE